MFKLFKADLYAVSDKENLPLASGFKAFAKDEDEFRSKIIDEKWGSQLEDIGFSPSIENLEQIKIKAELEDHEL